MQQSPDRRSQSDKRTLVKRYHKPTLALYGTISDLTQGGESNLLNAEDSTYYISGAG